MLQTMDLKQGDRVRLADYGDTDLAYRRRLLSFGLTPGVELRVIRRAPLGCPLQVDVRGISLIFRQDDAQYLVWEEV